VASSAASGVIPKLQSLGPRYENEIVGPPLTPREQ
jgi:hypothetical protein